VVKHGAHIRLGTPGTLRSQLVPGPNNQTHSMQTIMVLLFLMLLSSCKTTVEHKDDEYLHYVRIPRLALVDTLYMRTLAYCDVNFKGEWRERELWMTSHDSCSEDPTYNRLISVLKTETGCRVQLYLGRPRQSRGGGECGDFYNFSDSSQLEEWFTCVRTYYSNTSR